MKHELSEARDQLARMQHHAKAVVEKERDHVQRLQRELSSTKEMLRTSQKQSKAHATPHTPAHTPTPGVPRNPDPRILTGRRRWRGSGAGRGSTKRAPM